MDATRFGMSRRPFRPTPDTSTYCPTDTHEAASAAVTRAFAGGGGVAVLDGEPGTGKTLVGLRFLESLPADTRRVMAQVPPGVTPTGFFQAILFDLGKPYLGMSEQELRLAVYGELLTALDDGRRVAILADEAHHLTPEVLEEVRLLGNLESREAKAAFVLLLGPPPHGSTAFHQRVAVRCRLTPLSTEDSVRYVRHQIRECGGRPEWVIGDEALALLAERCGGVPRVLGRAAELAFETAAAGGGDAVDAEAVYEALALLDLLPDDPPTLLPLTPSAPVAEPIPPTDAQVKRVGRPMQKGTTKRPKRKSA
jgi:type II secretory pathway predicted ATPase ExeA